MTKGVREKVIDVLREIYDPEIPVNIYEIGLIYEVNVDEDAKAHILMTLTSPMCPVAESLPPEVEEKVAAIEGITSATVLSGGVHTWTVRAYNVAGYSDWASTWTVEVLEEGYIYLPLTMRNYPWD